MDIEVCIFQSVCLSVCVDGWLGVRHHNTVSSVGFPPNTNCLMRVKGHGWRGQRLHICVCMRVIKEQCQQGGPVLEGVTIASSRPSPTFGHYHPTPPITASLCVCVCVSRPTTKLLNINTVCVLHPQFIHVLCHFHLANSLAHKFQVGFLLRLFSLFIDTVYRLFLSSYSISVVKC